MLPLPVLEQAAKEITNYNGTGMSVMEMSHRAKCYEAIIQEAEVLLRELINLPANYKILFVQGGASTQFAAVPLNLTVNGKADYVVTGNFANQALKEGKHFTQCRVVASSEDKNHTYIPKLSVDMFDTDADYVHITTNNTIFGTKYTIIPETGNVPLVADMSSNILSEVMDFSDFDVVYAGAQKNIAPAGLTVVIVREDLLNRAMPICPTMLSWKTMAENDSLYNTPPTYSIYMAMLVFRWLKALGGISEMEKINKAKAKILYDFIDQSSFYTSKVEKEFRSIMNIPFVTPSAELDEVFVKEASKNSLVTLKGHRLVGGMRASIYNAMPTEGVQALVDFMKKFELANK